MTICGETRSLDVNGFMTSMREKQRSSFRRFSPNEPPTHPLFDAGNSERQHSVLISCLSLGGLLRGALVAPSGELTDEVFFLLGYLR
jgi:hypothetical protein